MENKIINETEVNNLYYNIKELIDSSRNRVYRTVNIEMINLYWNIGKMIIDKQGGKNRAKYGDLLIEGISKKLTERYGKGFSIQNLRRMRQFYITYPIRSTLSSELSVSHYFELIRIKDENKTIGILLSTDKNETIVKYTLPEDNKTIFSSEFRLTIPSEKEFIDVIENEKRNMEVI